jgi:hypothetical protein
VYKPHFFDKNSPSKIGVWLKHGILCPFDDWARDAGIICCETPSGDRYCLRLLSCKLLHMHECAKVLSMYWYDATDFQKSEDRDITDKLP